MKTKYAFLAVAVIVSGCASEYEQCVGKAYSEVRSIQTSITSIEENLARGYAIHVSEEPYVQMITCYNNKNEAFFCPETFYRTVENPVAIDAQLERSKLASLKARLGPAQRKYQSEVKSCEGLDGS